MSRKCKPSSEMVLNTETRDKNGKLVSKDKVSDDEEPSTNRKPDSTTNPHPKDLHIYKFDPFCRHKEESQQA